MGYRIINESRLDDATADRLVRFAWERTPGGIEGSTAIKLRNGAAPSGRAMRGAARKWARGAAHAMTTSVPPGDWAELGCPRVCWHATALRRHAENRYAEIRSQNGGGREPWMWTRAIADTYEWIEAQHEAGAARIGRWPIYITYTIEEAVVHTLAHELMHVLAADRDRGKQSELLCEEHALRVLIDYQDETKEEAA